MPLLARTWIAFAAIGSGLIHLGLVLGSPLALGVPLGILGLAEFAWGVFTFASETVLLPRVAMVVALAPVVGWAVFLVAGSPTLLAFVPLAVTTLFELFIAAVLAVHLRRPSTDAPAPTPLGRYLLGLAAGALVVAALTTAALAATQAGQHVSPDLFPGDHEPGH